MTGFVPCEFEEAARRLSPQMTAHRPAPKTGNGPATRPRFDAPSDTPTEKSADKPQKAFVRDGCGEMESGQTRFPYGFMDSQVAVGECFALLSTDEEG